MLFSFFSWFQYPTRLLSSIGLLLLVPMAFTVFPGSDCNLLIAGGPVQKLSAPASESQPPDPVPERGQQGIEKLPELPPALGKLVEQTTPLNPAATVFADISGKRVILRTEVACRNCQLEMLCVPEGMKEHETILRIRSKAYVVHTGLLAIGLEPGKPAQFSPEFKPATGTLISIYASWVDADGALQRQDVRKWIRRNIHRYYSAPLASPPPGLKLPYKELRYDQFNNELLWYGPMTEEDQNDLLSKWDDTKYQKAIRRFHQDGKSVPMEADFVFVGSRFYQDPETGKQYYQAEGGYMICVANFTDALLDIRESSSADDGAHSYEAWTENIPPEGTAVLLELVPIPDPEPKKTSPQKLSPAPSGDGAVFK